MSDKTPTKRKMKTKSEYAEMLGTTVWTVNKWIDENPALYNELVIAGYNNRYNKYWTPAQLQILDKHLR